MSGTHNDGDRGESRIYHLQSQKSISTLNEIQKKVEEIFSKYEQDDSDAAFSRLKGDVLQALTEMYNFGSATMYGEMAADKIKYGALERKEGYKAGQEEMRKLILGTLSGFTHTE